MHRTRASALMMAAAMDHEVDVPGAGRSHHRRARRPGPDHRHLRSAPGAEAAHRQIPRLRLVEPALPARTARPGRRPHCTARATAGGRGCWTRNGSTSTTSGRTPTSRSRATRNPSRRCGSGCFTWCRPAPGPSAARSPARGSPERATTATPSGTPRVSCCRCSPTRCRTRSPTHCAGGRRRWTWPRSGPPNSASTVPLSLADHPRAGVLGLLAGGHRGLAHQRRHRDGLRALPHRRPATTRWKEDCGLTVLIETARLWMSLGHHDRARRVAPRRGHRSRRVHRDRARQRLHEPDGRTQPASPPPRPATATRMRPRELGVTTEEMAAWRDAAAPSTSRTTRNWAYTSNAKASPGSRSGISRPTTPIRCCCTRPTCGSIPHR